MCYKQKCKVVSLNLAHPVDCGIPQDFVLVYRPSTKDSSALVTSCWLWYWFTYKPSVFICVCLSSSCLADIIAV